jgi:hypothetical protein
MSQTEQILDRFIETQGWSDNTVLDLCLTYIENQSSPEAWEDYLTSLKEVDDDMETDSGPFWDNARLMFVCDRHDGRWGWDETCPRCTDEDGNIRPTAEPGPLGPGAAS